MKQALVILSLTAVFAACGGPDTEKAEIVIADTVSNEQDQAINTEGLGDTIITNEGAYIRVKPEQPAARPAVKTRVVAPPVKAATPVATSTDNAAAPVATTQTKSETETASTPAPVQEKKGWSNAAKGAVIGASSGAVAGAIISKKKGTGAIIGGIIGAGGGYAIGKSKDKKAQRDTLR